MTGTSAGSNRVITGGVAGSRGRAGSGGPGCSELAFCLGDATAADYALGVDAELIVYRAG